MRKIYLNQKKLVLAACIAIPAAAAAVLLPKAVKHAKCSKSACA